MSDTIYGEYNYQGLNDQQMENVRRQLVGIYQWSHDESKAKAEKFVYTLDESDIIELALEFQVDPNKTEVEEN